MGSMRQARITDTRVTVSSYVTVELPDGTGATMHNTRLETGGTVQDAATAAGRHLDTEVRQQIDAMVAIIEGGVSTDGDRLWMQGGTPWVDEAWDGAVVDVDGCLWVQMENWPGDQWLSPTGHGVREWPELAFPVRLAPAGWAAGLGK